MRKATDDESIELTYVHISKLGPNVLLISLSL